MGTLARNRLRIKRYTTEAVVWRCSSKQLLLKSSQNSQENNCARVFFNSIKKETQVQVFSRKFCEIFSNTFFTRHLWTTASGDNIRYFLFQIGPGEFNLSFGEYKKAGYSGRSSEK